MLYLSIVYRSNVVPSAFFRCKRETKKRPDFLKHLLWGRGWFRTTVNKLGFKSMALLTIKFFSAANHFNLFINFSMLCSFCLFY